MDGSEPLKGRQETFVQAYAKGDISASQAYIQAGYVRKGANGHSARLVAKDSIKARIAHLRAELAEKYEITREKQVVKLARAYDMAEKQENPSAMVKATEACNRMYGLDKQVILNEEEHQALTVEEEQRYQRYLAWCRQERRREAIRERAESDRGQGLKTA
jgi:phage terminase small subunit